jgi:hypothetical protein
VSACTDVRPGAQPSEALTPSLLLSCACSSSTVDPVTGEKNSIPTVTVTSETGNKANIKIYNVFVGQVRRG